MAEAKLDNDGRISLPREVREALGWKLGQTLQLQVSGDQLLVQPATPTSSLKDEARRLAAAMRELASTTLGGSAPQTESTPERSTAPAPPSTPESPGAATFGAFQGIRPRLEEGVYCAPGSSVIGDVSVGRNSSIWPGAILRGDVAPVRVGENSNIQEGAVLHVSPQLPCVVGARVTIGHQATVHGCTVEDDVLIGIQAVVLDGATIGRHTIVAAGCVVPPGMAVPPGKMVMGVPAKVVRDLTPQEIERIHWNADSYVALKDEYLHPRATAAEIMPAPPQPPVPAAPPARGALPRYECRRATGEITIDGALDDPGWAGIPPLSRLRLASGEQDPTQETEVKACWDDTHLYVSFACKDTDIWASFENRDDPLSEEEVVEIFLCPTGDVRHYFEIEISPRNVVFDARVFNPDGDRRTLLVDREWDATGLRTAVRISGRLNDRSSPDLGWIVEVALPWSDLGLLQPPSPGTVWRANFTRIERGETTEFSAWSPTYREPADFHVPACFGVLVFTE